eukprot:scaffold8604_cov168-Amphora_coffeaeformis.AAC.1
MGGASRLDEALTVQRLHGSKVYLYGTKFASSAAYEYANHHNHQRNHLPYPSWHSTTRTWKATDLLYHTCTYVRRERRRTETD